MADQEMEADQTALTEEAKQLINEGVSVRVAQRVSEIFSSGALSPEELDDRALDALREFNEEGALQVLDQFASSDLSHVQNKSAFLCGVMKTFREKNRRERDGAAVAGESGAAGNKQGPDEDKIKALLERTGFTLDITTGQRKYGGPPPGWTGPPPGTGTEVREKKRQFHLFSLNSCSFMKKQQLKPCNWLIYLLFLLFCWRFLI